jgi:hypothetical protein
MKAGRSLALRAVLILYAIGHLTTSALFTFWPRYFIEQRGPRPPAPLSLVHGFGAWPPLHTGFMNVLAAYDLAVAFALLLAALDPVRNAGILWFLIVLWTVHGATHAAHILWGTSPPGYWSSVAELWLGAVLLLALRPGRPPTPLRGQGHEA